MIQEPEVTEEIVDPVEDTSQDQDSPENFDRFDIGEPETPEVEERDLSSEEKARKLNWTPKEEWRGDPEKWVDAKTFLDRTEPILPLVKKDRDKLIKKLDKVERELEATKETWRKHHEADRSRLVKSYEAEIKKLKADQKAAAAEGDVDAYEKAETAREELEAKRRDEEKEAIEASQPVTEKAPKEIPEEILEWGNENKWFGKDPRKTKIMQHVAEIVMFDNPGMDKLSRKFYDDTLTEAKRMYPDEFGVKNPRRETRSTGAVVSHSREYAGRANDTGGKSFADLPPEAKQAAIRLKDAGMPIKQYVAEYFGLPGGIEFKE